MKLSILAVIAAVLVLPAHEAADGWIQMGMHGATANAHKADRKRWRELGAEMKKLTPEDVRWGKERRPRGTQVVTLSTPYPTSYRQTIEVECSSPIRKRWSGRPPFHGVTMRQ